MAERVTYPAGHRFGRWQVLGGPVAQAGRLTYSLRCACGTEKTAQIANMVSGRSTSCGCFRSEALGFRRTTHKMSGTLAYEAWQSMHRRCRSHPGYKAKGIEVCPRWEVFEAFLEDMGDLPFKGATLERVRNAEGYSKENCQWLHKSQQGRNTSRTLYVQFQGLRHKFVDLVDASGLPYKTAYRRYAQLGWSLERTLGREGAQA